MARPRRETCIRCGRHAAECGTLSARYRCRDCGIGAAIETMDQLHAHNGPRFSYWRAQLLAAFGVTPQQEGGNSDDS